MSRRWVYTEGGRPLPEPIEVTEDWNDAPRVIQDRVDLYMNGLKAPDGTPIESKRQRREYMKRAGVVDASDFTQHWKDAAKQRERVRSGEADRKERRELIGRTMYELRSKRR